MQELNEMTEVWQRVLDDILVTICPALHQLFEIAIIEKDEDKNKTYSSSGICIQKLQCWEQPLINYNGKDLRIILYVNDEKKLHQMMGNSFYSSDRNTFPMLEVVILEIMEELSKVICDDLKTEKYTKQYPGDKEAIMVKAVIDFFIENGLPSPTYITYISSLTYEGEECSGKIKFVKFEDVENIDAEKILKVADDIYMSDHRIIRKLLELSNDKAELVVDTEWKRVLGIEYENSQDDSNDFYSIEFIKNMNWILYYKNMKVVEFKNGIYSIYDYANLDNQVSKKLKELYKNDQQLVAQACELINVVREQKHGTLVVVTSLAEEEAKRLCELKRGIKIEKFFALDHIDIFKSITAIYGAILLDNQFCCYDIGVILDGVASGGTQSRGARYNSAVTYVNSKKSSTKDIWAVVISEDGMVDIVT